MGIFGGEKHSREGFEGAKKGADAAYKSARFRGTITGMSEEAKREIYDGLWDRSTKADARVEKLYAKGQTEAVALNEEYDRLRIQAQEAIEAIADFEREKLGMHKEGPDSPREETKEKS